MKTRINKISLQGFKSFRKRVSVPFFPGFVVFCGPNGVGKSARGDTQILLSNGDFRSIKDLVETSFEKSEQVFKMDDGFYTLENPEEIKVLGLDPQRMEIREKEVASFVKRKGEKKLVKIQTRSGREIVTTKCHPVMIFKDGKIIPIKVSKLAEGELIATPNEIDIPEKDWKIEIPEEKFKFKEQGDFWILFKDTVPYCKKVKIPKHVNREFAKFFGYLTGDGFIQPGVRCDFTNSNEELIKDFVNVSKKFGIRPTTKSYKRSAKTVMIFSSLLSKFVEHLMNGKVKSDNKNIPKEILFSRKQILANFLAALFDCDGYVSKTQPSFEYCTKSEVLARQVQFALLRFGIYSVFTRKKKYASNTVNKTKRTYYTVHVEGIEDLKEIFNNIRIRSREKIKRLRRHVFKPVVSRTNVDIFSKEVNDYIHKLALMLGVHIKKERRKYPRFAAYCENRCHPTRDGIEESLVLFRYKQTKIKELLEKLSPKKDVLVKVLKGVPILQKDIGKNIGVAQTTVSRWSRGWGIRKKNLIKLMKFLRKTMNEIIKESDNYIKLLNKLVKADVIWDKIVKIEEVPGEKWVYDLCIPNCHNFIGNLIFVHNSNILDAITFVLGGTSTKALRAGRLHELIYHGNGDIPPSEYASVTLWLDNSDKLFPYETPEVAVKRKINKKGVSVFKINGKTTTREKILELLSSARIHPDGFNIIMQGDVSQVIEMTPQERRNIIDEISGIAHYNEKKEKAQKNLDIVGEKLKEVEIILTERLERLQELETDRNTALKYKELRDKLERLEASLAYKRFQIEEKKYAKMEEEIKNCEEEIQKLEDDIKLLEKEIESKEKRREKIREIIFVRTKETGIREEIENIKNKILRNKDKIESDQREIERINNMIEKLGTLQERRPALFKKGVKAILDLKKSGVYGTVADLIKIPKEYATAIEVAGGSRLQNLVVNNAKTATDCINYLKKKKIGRATFLPLNRIKPRKLLQKSLLKKPGVVGLITDLINYKSKYAPAIQYVFGDTVIVENLGVARSVGIGNVRMVTLDGDLVEISGAMIGGYYKKREEIVGGVGIDIETYENNKKDLEEEINFLRIEIGQLNKKMDELRESKEEETKEVLDLEEERTKIDEELVEMKSKRNEMFESRIALQNRINKLKISSAKKEAELNNLKLELEKYKEIEYIDEKPAVLEFQIQQTTSVLNSLGLVNMKAIEEYDAFKGEFDELKHKYDKIRDEKQAIIDMIEKIEGKRKEVFYECLRSIDKNFREVFREIAKGSASIELENPLDIESGLLIQANPAGKNMLNIDAMSGGEKALTALAFLFAIQKYKPAPFYVLDEVDAFLDKVNTKRIVEMIKKLSEKEQFIVITHNDYTIKQGDRVYGISMENGESKILGLELPKGEAG